MTKMLELREKLRNFYGKYEMYVAAGMKFIVALAAFFIINKNIGYMEKLENPVVVLILALACTFLPVNAIMLIGAGLILAHLSALSLEICLLAACLFLLMLFMYYKFAPRNGYGTVLTLVLCNLKIPQTMPVAMGLLKGPSSYLSMVCGTVAFYYLKGIKENAANFTAMEETDKTSKITVALKLLVENKEMFLAIAAFCITALVVYGIRRMSVDHAWRIASVAGNVIGLVILLVGYILLGTSDMVPWILIGTGISVVVSLLLEFFLYNLDYSRVEKVQFEDDEYYYFVKAVPKVYVAEKSKKVKQITPKKRTINRKELAEELDIDQDLLE